jgi:Lipid A 3-O-deacylase (PagL)
MHRMTRNSIAATAASLACTFVARAADPSVDALLLAEQQDAKTAGSAAAAPVVPVAAVPAKFGTKDTWRLDVEGEGMTDLDAAWQAQFRIGAAWFFAQDAELAFYGTGGYVWQPGTDAATYGFDMEVRWHFLARDTWSLFGSIGGSVMGSTQAVPSGGSELNFTPSIGGGATFEVAPDVRTYVELRWYHISNAGTHADNPGRNNIALWAGLSFAL